MHRQSTTSITLSFYIYLANKHFDISELNITIDECTFFNPVIRITWWQIKQPNHLSSSWSLFPPSQALLTIAELTDAEVERYFNYAAVWAFAGTLEMEHRDTFSQWWKTTFREFIDYPDEGTVRK